MKQLRNMLILSSAFLVIAAMIFVIIALTHQEYIWAAPISLMCVILSILFNIVRTNMEVL